ncbi:hypothetical protein J4E89_002777 [Alternaria sp. Ai002NY15]|nr:hypothetical protein J4E89_002777 [Alternaria sp. Ai002NY15]
MGLPKDILSEWVLFNVKKFDRTLVEEPVNGTRKISGQLLSPPDTVMASSASSSSAQVAQPHPDLEVPLNLYSMQAFEFLGFTSSAAESLLAAWTRDDEADLEDVIIDRITYFGGHGSVDERTIMSKIGISAELQEKVMDPEYEDVRSTQSLSYWILETIFENIWTLKNLSERLNRNLAVIQSGKTPFASLRGGAPEDRSKYHLTRVGHTTLYRSTSAAQLERVFGEHSLNLDLNFQFRRGIHTGDFHNERRGYCWSSQHWVSEHFAAYTCSRIKSPTDVCIIRALVPTHLLQGQGVWALPFGDDWKKLVWHSTRELIYPADIQEKLDKSTLIIGPVSINFSELKSWKQATEDRNCYTVKGEVAKQYVWVGMASIEAMNEPLKEKWDLFRGRWKLCTENTYADCSPRHIPEPQKWARMRL